MNRRVKLAIAMAGALVVSAGAAVGASSALAFGPSSQSLAGSLFLVNTPAATNATTNNTYTDTFTLTRSPAGTLTAGTTVTVTLAATTGSVSGPIPVGAGWFVIRGSVALSGAQTGTVNLLDVNSVGGTVCAYPTGPIGTNSPQGAYTLSGTFTASGNGTTDIALRQIFFDDQGNLDGSAANVCTGSNNNADYYASAVTQTAGSGQPGLAKTAPVASTVIKESFNVGGPNATITASGGQSAGVQAVRMSSAFATFLSINGSLWPANQPNAAITLDWCDVTGTSCVNPGFVQSTFLSTNASGILNGTIVHNAGTPGPTTGNRAMRITIGASTALVPVLVLPTPTVTLTPAAQSPGSPVSISGSGFNPLQPVTAKGATAITGVGTWTPSTDPSVVLGNASATGTISGSYTFFDVATKFLAVYQGTPQFAGPGNPVGYANVTVNQDRCVAYGSNISVPGGIGDIPEVNGCRTGQNINASVTQGRLVQRAYVNVTPTTGSIDGSAIVSPIQGTANVNPDATTVNLGSVTAPLAPTTIVGNLNDITVSDNRGGSFGWTLSATMPDFTGSPNSNTIDAAQLEASPACAPATNATAWDYNAVGKSAIVGFDDTLNAPGVTAGAAGQDFGGTVNLCTKNATENAVTQTTGGVYNVTSSLTLTVPAFQAADKYTSTITVLLA